MHCCNDAILFQNVQSFAKRIECTELRATVQAFLKALMTKNRVVKYSWLGRKKTKIGFKESATFKVLKGETLLYMYINAYIKYFGFCNFYQFVLQHTVTIDNKLNFKEHINVLATKTSRSLGVPCKLCHILLKLALRNLNHSMIHLHLLYETTIWGNAFDKHLIRLATLQNKAVKPISGA